MSPRADSTKMRVIEVDNLGRKARLRLAERDVPRPGPGEVLIRVSAAGINRPDLLQRRGLYPPPEGASEILGLEVAGTLDDAGAGVEGWSRGDRVMALVTGGGYAEFCIAPAQQCLRVPESLDIEEAAALPEGLFTIFANVFDQTGFPTGGTLLVHGGSSGIGTLAIRMVKAAGGHIITTSRTEEKRRACERLGADRAVLCPEEDFRAAVMEHTRGRGVDVVLDMVGRDYYPSNLACLAEGGRHASIAFLTGGKVEVDLLEVMKRRLVITGSTLRARSVAEKGRLRTGLLEQFGPALEAGQLRPVVAEVLPMAEAERAHQLLHAGGIVGKLVLRTEA